MKKLLVLVCMSLFLTSSVFAQALFSVATLKSETAKALPKDVTVTNEDQDERSAFMAYTNAKQGSYQFTLSKDKEVQAMVEETITIDGRECQFFRPMGDSSGGLFIPLKNEKGSLAILLMYNMFSDETVSSADLKAIAEKMDISLFD